MYELDQYKQKHGDLDMATMGTATPFAALTADNTFPSSPQ